MSRIGRNPIPIPNGVTVEAQAGSVTVKGPKGTLTTGVRPEIDVAIEDAVVSVTPNGRGSIREQRSFHGLTRALINNMVLGVTEGFTKTLEIVGVGWNAQAAGKELTLNVGYCHPVKLSLPEGVECECTNPTTIVLRGNDKQVLGHFAAQVRAARPPEPYKGKGIRFQGEYVRRKVGKSFGS